MARWVISYEENANKIFSHLLNVNALTLIDGRDSIAKHIGENMKELKALILVRFMFVDGLRLEALEYLRLDLCRGKNNPIVDDLAIFAMMQDFDIYGHHTKFEAAQADHRIRKAEKIVRNLRSWS